MDLVTLSRIQFAVTVGFHFIFVPLTLGLVILVAIMETIYVKTNNEIYKRMAKFWGKLFIINFALGVVTGITMEFQFGTNWANYSKYVGDIFGAPLAIEATVAFFLESSFIGLWIYGWDKISKKLHAFSIWMVALGTNLSAVWIIIANGWMQHPVGYVIRNGRAELVDFLAVITNKYAWLMFSHTVMAGYLLSSFFVLGVSAYHLLKGTHLDFFKKSFKIGLIFAVISSLGVAIIGDVNGSNVAKDQPAKLAAMEAIWDTQAGAPMYLLTVPDEKNETNSIEALAIPKLASFLAYKDPNATIVGLNDIPADERPPVNIVFYSFRLMVVLGGYFIFMSLLGWYFYKKNKLLDHRFFLKLLVFSIPLPYIAIDLGWIVAEVGRQPWIVYGLMKTVDGVSPVAISQVVFSLVGVTLFYTALVIVDIYLLTKNAKLGLDSNQPEKLNTTQSKGLNA